MVCGELVFRGGPPKGLICVPLTPKSDRTVKFTRSVNLPSGSNTARKLSGPERATLEVGWPILRVPLLKKPTHISRCSTGFQLAFGVLVPSANAGGGSAGLFTHWKVKLESSLATKMLGEEEDTAAK